MTVHEITVRGITKPRRASDPLMTTLIVACSLLIVLAIVGPFVSPYSPDATDVLSADQTPSLAHLLGTDSLGRDVFSRLLTGARLTFSAAFFITSISAVLGTFVALFAAWHGGWVDGLISRTLNVLFAIPGILIALLAVAVFGKGFGPPVFALTIVYVPYLARVVRGAAIQQRKRAYVEAADLAGLGAWRINIFHILRNVVPLVLAQSTFSLASALVDFGAISFLGLGVQAPQSEWGLMVAEGRSDLLSGYPQVSVSAGVMIVLSVVAFNLLGERISNRMAVNR